MDKQKRAVLSIEVPLELRETFIAAAAANDMTGSQLLRAFMREYIRKNSHSDLFRPLEKQAA
ncbi:MAG TPA: plasmid-related protein [Rhodocyclaceae bacterium]|uniref:plasmid-related protein n=1 Tax=Azospira oryzae TaxID=146939 RepID=UPI001964DBBD|nr:plasmid-related protein [Azospira oryzae]